MFSILFFSILILFFSFSGLYFIYEYPERSYALWGFSALLLFFFSWINVYYVDNKKIVVRKFFFPKKKGILLKDIKKVDLRIVNSPIWPSVVMLIHAKKDLYFDISLNYSDKSLKKFLAILKEVLGKKFISSC